jgi:hypothetical protein
MHRIEIPDQNLFFSLKVIIGPRGGVVPIDTDAAWTGCPVIRSRRSVLDVEEELTVAMPAERDGGRRSQEWDTNRL